MVAVSRGGGCVCSWGGVCSLGVSALGRVVSGGVCSGGVSAPGGVCSGGGVCSQWGVCSWGGGCLLPWGVSAWGVSAPEGVCLLPGGVSAPGGKGCLLLGEGDIPPCTDADTPSPCGQTETAVCLILLAANSSAGFAPEVNLRNSLCTGAETYKLENPPWL